MIEKITYIVLLKDFYGPLLTERQQQILSLHYENDWSLSEIADDMNISRQAVYDIVKRAENLLKQYEQKLGLVDKFQRTRRQLQEVAILLNSGQDDRARISEAIKIINDISDIL